VMEFYSGATTYRVAASEGLLLRRSHATLIADAAPTMAGAIQAAAAPQTEARRALASVRCYL
jgi:hypothetical protein